MKTSFVIRSAAPEDRAHLLELIPRLGSFPLPAHRRPEEIYQGDERVLVSFLDGTAPDCRLWIAAPESGTDIVAGLALVRMRPDSLNESPSAHLEALTVSESWEGRGVGGALLRHAEQEAAREGAKTLTLHVFETNSRAKALYERHGYAPELLRYIKVLD